MFDIVRVYDLMEDEVLEVEGNAGVWKVLDLPGGGQNATQVVKMKKLASDIVSELANDEGWCSPFRVWVVM